MSENSRVILVLMFLNSWMQVLHATNICNVFNCFEDILGQQDVTLLNDFNNDEIFPRLQTLLRRPYFKYFQYNSKKTCRFSLKSRMGTCNNSGCRVRPCAKNEVPSGLIDNPKSEDCSTTSGNNVNLLYDVDSTIAERTLEDLELWNAHDSNTLNFCDPDGCKDCDFVDLTINPERYTGYSGKPASEMWRTIYDSGTRLKSQSCSQQKAFFCAISGLQSSIGIHIASQYPKESGGYSTLNALIDHHGPNKEEFSRRFGGNDGRFWLRNLYFVYLIELKALSKADNYLRKKKVFTGNIFEDGQTLLEVGQVLDIIQTLPNPFNQSVILKGLTTLDKTFFNTSQVMDCIECDKCKLWGKLQVAGLGTALKILLLPNARSENWNSNYQLSRNEVVSLWNAFGRLSTSIFQLQHFSASAKKRSEL